MQTIRTKWHKIIPLIQAGEAYLTAPPEQKAPHLSQYHIDASDLASYIRMFSDLPKFAIDMDLIDIAAGPEYTKSLIDMKQAGVLRLPFPAMIVEFTSRSGNCHFMCVLRDIQAGGRFKFEEPGLIDQTKKPFYAWLFRVQKDDEGEYLVVSPSISFLDAETRQDGEIWVGVSSQGWADIKPPDHVIATALNNLISATYTKDAGGCWHALVGGLLLMNTAGVQREVIEVERLNRKRKQLGKEPVPRHTYIRIGHVYKHADSSQADAYEPRRSPRPHWRRGHIKTFHIGKGRTGTRQVYIQPKLVAYHGVIDDEPTQQHEYVVTR